MSRSDPFGRKPLDQFIGKRIMRARAAQRLTRQDLASRLNLPVDCLAAFETGKRRVPPGALLDIASVLRRRISFFFSTSERHAPAPLPLPGLTPRRHGGGQKLPSQAGH